MYVTRPLHLAEALAVTCPLRARYAIVTRPLRQAEALAVATADSLASTMSSAMIGSQAQRQQANELAASLSRLVLVDAVHDETAIQIGSADAAYHCSAQRRGWRGVRAYAARASHCSGGARSRRLVCRRACHLSLRPLPSS